MHAVIAFPALIALVNSVVTHSWLVGNQYFVIASVSREQAGRVLCPANTKAETAQSEWCSSLGNKIRVDWELPSSLCRVLIYKITMCANHIVAARPPTAAKYFCTCTLSQTPTFIISTQRPTRFPLLQVNKAYLNK